MPLILSQRAQYAGLDLRPGIACFCVPEVFRELSHALVPFVAIHSNSVRPFTVATCLWHVLPDAPSATGRIRHGEQGRGYNTRRIARRKIQILTSDPFHFGVHAA